MNGDVFPHSSVHTEEFPSPYTPLPAPCVTLAVRSLQSVELLIFDVLIITVAIQDSCLKGQPYMDSAGLRGKDQGLVSPPANQFT